MATNITLVLDTRRARKDNTFPIIFRIGHNRRTVGINSGYSIKKNFWDARNRNIKGTYKGIDSPTRLNNYLQKQKSAMIDIITALADKDQLATLSVGQLKNRLIDVKLDVSVFTYTKKLIKEFRTGNRIGTARCYQGTLNVLKTFRRDKDMAFEEMSDPFLRSFEAWHLSKGNSYGGLSVYIRTLRAIYNKAINAGHVQRQYYPFHTYQIRSGNPRKRALPIDAIRKIKALNLIDNPKLDTERNIFLLSFYLRGMPYTDLAHLKVSNIIDGRIQFNRQKTTTALTVNIPEQALPLLETFTKEKEKNDYVLDVIKREEPNLKYKDVHWARKRHNKALQKIAELVGIEEKLTSYVARHSYASIADEMEVPVTAISQMLGHKKIATTQSYLGDLRKTKLDEYQDKVVSDL